MVVGLLLAWLLVLVIFTTSRTRGGEGREGRERNWMGFSSREARLAGRVREGEARVQWLTLQLENPHKKLARVGPASAWLNFKHHQHCFIFCFYIAGCCEELCVGVRGRGQPPSL